MSRLHAWLPKFLFVKPRRPQPWRANLLSVAQLEDRVTPANFTVLNRNDSGPDSLRDCIAKANATADADTITFNIAGTIALTTGELTVTNPLTITGKGVSFNKISGNNASRIFNGSNLTLSNLTLMAGKAVTGSGGAITGTGLTISDCVITGSSSGSFGGGIYADGLTLTRTTISNNTTGGAGGGVYAFGLLTVSDSLFTGNFAGSTGGALGFDSIATATVQHCTFTGNTANSGAGAITLGA